MLRLLFNLNVDLRNKGITGRPERSTLDEVKARLQRKRMELLMKQQRQKKQSSEVAGMDYAAEDDDYEREKEKVESGKRKEAEQVQSTSKKSDSENDSDDDDPYKKLGLPMSFK